MFIATLNDMQEAESPMEFTTMSDEELLNIIEDTQTTLQVIIDIIKIKNEITPKHLSLMEEGNATGPTRESSDMGCNSQTGFGTLQIFGTLKQVAALTHVRTLENGSEMLPDDQI